MNKPLLSAWAYPAVIGSGLFLHVLMFNLNLGLQISTYIPVILAVLAIMLLEYSIPYRSEWVPDRSEVKNDLLFTVLVQIVFPKFLAFFIAITFLEYYQAQSTVPAISHLWFHNIPIILQVVLMMVIAEFLRYWLHRASHTTSFLWRFHAVHHSPDKLYWLNVGRFHFFDKFLQFLFDTLPFILIGVSPEVISAYFVFYAINGFFQHSNINVNMGFLNYIISGAPLHRWHHSKDATESGKNYGNNLIIWDIVFGSRYLPDNKNVGDLGLYNPSYPSSFLGQLKAPFTPGLDKFPISILGLGDIWLNTKVKLGLWLATVVYKIPFMMSLSDPMRYQRKFLKEMVVKNKNSEYGQLHKFDQIETYQDFINKIPIQDYEDLRSFIEKQAETNTPTLTSENPDYYAVTSGTTGKPKYIPVLNESIQQQRRALAIFATVQNNANKHVFSGKLLAIPGAYNEGELDNGSIYGSISGLMYFLMPEYLQNKYVVKNDVFALEDYELKYRLIIRLAIQHASLGYIVTANPSTLLKLIEIINDEIAVFTKDIETGSFNHSNDLPEDLFNSIKDQLLCDTERAKELKKLTELNRKIDYSDIWPNLKLIVTWQGGSCGVAVDRLKPMLPATTQILELGYLSSEFRATITLEDTGVSGVPTFHDNFFEFIPVNDYEQGVRTTLTLDQLITGQRYFIIITTSAGLYRYFMNDIVEVTGFKKKTPLLRFIQKGKGVSNITGEKLSEHQLISAVEELNKDLDIDMPFYISLASVRKHRYELYAEATIENDVYSDLLDKKIQTLNTEYESKRLSNRLNKIHITPVRSGTGGRFKEHLLKKGLRESQFKYLVLQNEADCDFPFRDYIQ